MRNNTIGKKLTQTTLVAFVLIQGLLLATPVLAQYGITNTPVWAQPQPQTPGGAVSTYVPVAQPTGTAGTPSGGLTNTPTNTTSGQKGILQTIAGKDKQCPYFDQGLYKPFSNISTDFAIFKAFNMDSQAKAGCIKVQGGMDQFILLIFKVFIGFCSVLAVIYIAVAGISMITEQANIQKKIKAKDMLVRALQGLLLSLVAWILLFTINGRLVNFNVDDVFNATNFQKTIAQGLSQTSNFSIIQAGNNVQNYLEAPSVSTGPGYNPTSMGSAGTNSYAGTMPDSTGAYAISEAATVFGYRDGNGRTGGFGDNGVGGTALTHIKGRSNYTGDTRSVGVAVPASWIQRDFGSYAGAVNSAYAIYHNGIHKGNFPIVDASKSKLDFTYGAVIANFDPNPRRNSSNTDWLWSASNIKIKPLKDFWLSNPRPKNPMIQIKAIPGTHKDKGQGMWPTPEVLPSDIQYAIQQGYINVTME